MLALTLRCLLGLSRRIFITLLIVMKEECLSDVSLYSRWLLNHCFSVLLFKEFSTRTLEAKTDFTCKGPVHLKECTGVL
jgi:hypothetical protein